MLKFTFEIVLVLLIVSNINAQNPVIPLYNGHFKDTENAYYKDINNIHDLYVGEWLYTNGSDSLRIKLRERPMQSVSGSFASYYIDQLIEEYRYVENGVEKINTLSGFNQDIIGYTNYNIFAYSLQNKNTFPKCDECAEGEKRLVLTMQEPALSHLSGLRDDLIMRHYIENGIEKIKLIFPYYGGNIVINDNTQQLSDIDRFTVPYGTYILVKQ